MGWTIRKLECWEKGVHEKHERHKTKEARGSTKYTDGHENRAAALTIGLHPFISGRKARPKVIVFYVPPH